VWGPNFLTQGAGHSFALDRPQWRWKGRRWRHLQLLPHLTIIDSIISGNSARKGDGSVGFGGAIYNCPGSTLTVINTTFSGNRAEQGGAICNGGTLTINNSTFTGNKALRLEGGAIRNYGILTINNSTFSGNSAPGGIGGAINNGEAFGGKGTLLINNSTLSGNTAADGKGGGIFNPRVAVQAFRDVNLELGRSVGPRFLDGFSI
jgi:predicted outer membrane repeat protein